MSVVELAAIVIALGSVVFGLGASMPTSSVFPEPDPGRKLQIMTGAPTVWRFSQVGFAVGPTIAALGLGILALGLTSTSAAILGYLGTALFLIGVACWDQHVYLRAVDPEAFAQGRIPPWLFQVYTVLTCLGLVAFGAALLLEGFPAWLGATTVVVGLASLIGFILTRDMFPFVYYVLLLVVAWAIGPAWLGPAVLASMILTAVLFWVVKRSLPSGQASP